MTLPPHPLADPRHSSTPAPHPLASGSSGPPTRRGPFGRPPRRGFRRLLAPQTPSGRRRFRWLIVVSAIVVAAAVWSHRSRERAPATTRPAPHRLADRYASWLAPKSRCPVGHSTAGREREVRCLINYVRDRRGRRKLAPSSSLAKSASIKGRRVVACGELTHRPCGDDALVAFERGGYLRGGAYEVTENIAFDTRAAPSARHTMLVWLNSDDQRREILSRVWRDQGVAVLRGVVRGDRANVWVSAFGHR